MKNWLKFWVVLGVCFWLCAACEEVGDESSISFYHWKAKAITSDLIDYSLAQTKTETIYLHYFDVDLSKDSVRYPVYVLKEVAESYKQFDIVPVVFITNQTLKKEDDIAALGQQISDLIDQISQHHFGRKHNKIQLDCDWSQSTRQKYFELINGLSKQYQISVTIRLHQIKYPEKTGVPPVKQGVLMLYNMGDLADMNQNSILSTEIVADYIDEQSTYPIALDVALPLFSQTVVKNNEGKYRLINTCNRAQLSADTIHFQQKSMNLFEVKADTLYEGFYLFPGFEMKLEETNEETIISAYEMLKNSQLPISSIIFYHLDDAMLRSIDLNKIYQHL